MLTYFLVIFYNDTAPPEIYTLSLHDALPISHREKLLEKFWLELPPREKSVVLRGPDVWCVPIVALRHTLGTHQTSGPRSEEHTSELQSHVNLVCRLLLEKKKKKKINIYTQNV